jgi:hypothetical protein
MTTFFSPASVDAQLTNFAISVEQAVTLVSDTAVGAIGIVWVSDNYAYVGNNDSGVQIFDISNPVSPILKSNYGSYNIPSEGFNAKDIEVVGSYAYIASWDRGLKILDISDRDNPVSKATLAIPGQSYGTTGLQVVGNYAYVTNINSGLSIIDITNPSNPTLKGSYAGEGWDVQVIGDYAYIANGYSGLQIVNISDPTAPTLVSNFLGSQFYRQRGIEVVGTYVYVASELQGLLIIDISDPSAPILKGTYDTPGEAIRVSVEGNYAYVADETYGLQIINISNPTNPTLAENYDTSGSVADVKVIGDYAYVADGVGGLKIIDVSDFTANPINTGVISFSNSQFSVNEDGIPITQVTLARTGGSTGEVSVTLNLTDGTATAGNDYIQTPITVTFADGETSKIVNLAQASHGLSFDGNSYVNVGNQPSLVVSNAITMQAWINPTGAGISSYPGVGGAFINKQGEYQVFRFADGTIRWAFTNTDPGWFTINTGYVAPLNQWTNITVTYDLGLIKTYANGVLVHTYNGAGNIGDFNDATNEFEIGRSLGDESYFQGSIDEVRIWNKARTEAEIQADFNRELTGNETGLVGYWNFNSVNGNTVQDLTSNHNDGTLVGAQSTTGIVPTSLIINDKTYESDETLNLTLSNPTNGATLGTQQTAILSIVDNEQLIFADNFDDGASPLWGNEVGNWYQNQGIYDSQNPNNSPLTYSSLPYLLKDFSIELDINNVQDGGVFLRSTDNNNGVLLVTGGEIGTGTGFYWHIIQDGVVSGILNPSVSGLVQPGISNIHLKIEVVGDNYSVFLNNDLTPITTLTTSLFSSGKVALYDFSGLQTFDNVKVYSDVQTNTGVIFFSSPQFSVNEDGTPITQVTLTRTEGSTGEVSVTFNLTDGTATAGNDYDGTPITVTFADGETTKIVTIPIVNDTLSEPNETINLTLSNPTNGATLGTQTTASLTILDNDINNATLLNPVNFTLNGSAKFTVGLDGVSPVLRLTDDYYQLGRAFLTNTITLSNNTSFSSYFEFQISARGWGDEDGIGADGLSFAIQAASSDVDNVGSVEIEFDTFNNTPNNISDINGNHVGVNINGDINSVVSQPVTNRLNNGNIWSAWVDYNGLSDVLELRLSETNQRPTTAFLSYTVDLLSVLGQTDAFIGFTSRTGAGTGDHDILDWQFNNSYNPITEIANSELDFSGVQGLNNWYYGYYDGPFNSSDFQQMTQFNTDGSGGWQVQAGTYWTGIGSGTVHGNGILTSGGRTPVEQWAVRRWMSEANGTIQIEGHLAKTPTAMGGDGVMAYIFVDGVEVWSQSIDGYDATGINYQIDTVVNFNSVVDFALAPLSSDWYDSTIFTVQIKGIESDSPGILSFSSPQFSVNEDGTPVNQVTFIRTGGSAGAVSATLNLTDGTATSDSDYDGTPIIVTFADGETSKTVNIPIVDDTLYEGDEILNLTLSDPTGGATLGTQQTATLNIIDNDTPPPPSLLQVRLNLLKDNDGNPGDIINNDQIGLYQSFFVEILVGDFRDNAVGVNGLQLDFNWDGFILESINVPFDPTNIINSQFPLLQGGTLDNPNGLIDDLSGGSLPAFELGQAIGINQLDRFALLHFYAENITDGISYLTTAVDSVSLADDASYVLDVETAQPIEILGSTISITDNSEDANDASIRFTTALSQFRKNYQDSNLIRPNYADSSKYFDITNTGTGKLTISELRINVTGVSTGLDLTKGDLILNPNESQRVKLTYKPSAAREFFDRSDALVLVSNAVNSPELAIALSGKSTFNSDVNYDGKVNTGDLGSLNQARMNYNKGILDPTADITGDGLFNNLDVAMLQSENKLSLFA